MKQQDPVLKDPNASYIILRTEARKRKASDLEITMLKGDILV
jgi:hypothetical protein